MATVIIGSLVFGSFAGIAYYTYKSYQKGNLCSGNCENCGGSGSCHK